MATKKTLNRGQGLWVQKAVGAVLCLAGVALLAIGFYAPPQGEIHSSVLIAYGEISTFAGCMFGVVYHSNYRDMVRDREVQKLITKLKSQS